MKYHLLRALRRALRRLAKFANDFLPGRPDAELGARVSFRAKIEGVSRNIHVATGACIREAAWLNCMDAQSRIEIGSGTLIMPYTKLVAGFGGTIRIGRNCTVHSFDVLYGFSGGLFIGDGVRIGTSVTLVSSNHEFDDPVRSPNEQGSSSQGIRVGDGAWLGAGAIILDGVTIGPNAVIGAGAVVTKDIPADSVAVGVPARVIRRRGDVSQEPIER